MTLLATTSHILVVDDDERLRSLLKTYLTEQGFFVSVAANTREADELLHVFTVDGVVLDVMMPGETGIAYAQRLRSAGAAPPILLLTARGEAEDRIAGLEAGAADYLPKPFAPKELLLRLQNIVARQREVLAAKQSVAFGDFRFEIPSGRLSRGGEVIYLTSSESDCLRILAESAGVAVSREVIARTLGDVQNERSVDVQINRLRKKFEPQPGKPIYLQTIRHAGYVLYADPA